MISRLYSRVITFYRKSAPVFTCTLHHQQFMMNENDAAEKGSDSVSIYSHTPEIFLTVLQNITAWLLNDFTQKYEALND